MSNIYVALVHYPVYNKRNESITTSITNLDIHDIARSCRTFGVKNYCIITPVATQHELLGRLLAFWQTDTARQYNPDRVEALELIKSFDSLESAIENIKNQEQSNLIVVTTTAKQRSDQISFQEIRSLKSAGHPLLIVFGTGNGLLEEIHQLADKVLAPIKGSSEYNHLSVRSAVAIVLDRVLSEEYKEE